jgi:hypothetical protein
MSAQKALHEVVTCVFHAVLSAGRGDHHTIWFLSGDVTPCNLEALYTYVLDRATDLEARSGLREVKVTVTGTQRESILPEISRRLQGLEVQGVKVVIA